MQPSTLLYGSSPSRGGSSVSCDVVLLVSRISEREYEFLCSETLDALAERLENLAEEPFTSNEYDVSFSVSSRCQIPAPL